MSETKEIATIDNEELQKEIEFQKTLSPEENAKRVIELKTKIGFDTLTGLKNKDRITDQMETIEILFKRNGEKYCVLFVDVDNLKRINDTEGHDRGNEVISSVALALKEGTKRGSDLVGRWTRGDEFVVVLLEAGDDGAYTYYKRLNDIFKSKKELNNISLSIGASTCDFKEQRGNKKFLDVVGEADQAMYKAKERKEERSGNVGLIFYNEINKNEQK